MNEKIEKSNFFAVYGSKIAKAANAKLTIPVAKLTKAKAIGVRLLSRNLLMRGRIIIF